MKKTASNLYATEDLASALKRAREQKGMSQRELSAVTGVPQAHISKIESNTVDLRATSLVAILSALDLHLTLVPRRAMPAVKAIIRSMSAPSMPPEISNEMARIQDACVRRQRDFADHHLIPQLVQTVGALSQLRVRANDYEKLRDLLLSINAVRRGASMDEQLREAIEKATRLRERLRCRAADESVPRQRPMYRLDDEH